MAVLFQDSSKSVKLDEDQIAELREIFRSFDKNGDGSLTQLELGSLLRSVGLKPSPEQLEALTQRVDTNNDLVEFSEFVALVAPLVLPSPYKSPYSEEQLRWIFNLFDWDREWTMNSVAGGGGGETMNSVLEGREMMGQN
ncbi:probable calcium-binding protein CML11 [Punica granatum]|uniref:Probable calcium-binding protein CML11 n=1 Tax=Punica granatum TaxID=22663 RepID=A0A6P8DFS8_PUNGR|nr:probable calcium-binding protein CML11 [Punica granatum]